MASLTDIAGIDAQTAAVLRGAEIRSVARLLEAGASRSGRRRVAAATGLDEVQILAWVRHADLFRIKGVSGSYAVLLEAAGVGSVPDLAQQTAPGLWAAMERANSGGEPIARALPSVHTMRGWVAEARRLPALVRS